MNEPNGQVENIVSTSGTKVENRVMEGFRDRLELILKDKSVNAFAKQCHLSGTLLRKYLEGSVPGLDKIATMAAVAGVSFEWLATGEGAGPDNHVAEPSAAYGQGQDIDLLEKIIVLVEEGLAEKKIELTPEKKARFVVRLYRYFLERRTEEADKTNVVRFMDFIDL